MHTKLLQRFKKHFHPNPEDEGKEIKNTENKEAPACGYLSQHPSGATVRSAVPIAHNPLKGTKEKKSPPTFSAPSTAVCGQPQVQHPSSNHHHHQSGSPHSQPHTQSPTTCSRVGVGPTSSEEVGVMVVVSKLGLLPSSAPAVTTTIIKIILLYTIAVL